MDTYLTEAEVSTRYKVSKRTLQRWRVTGDGPRFVRLGPRRIVYRASDIEAWTAAQTHEHRAAESATRAA
jgi:predicted DNA-binding transcriptional regulator AlpA